MIWGKTKKQAFPEMIRSLETLEEAHEALTDGLGPRRPAADPCASITGMLPTC